MGNGAEPSPHALAVRGVLQHLARGRGEVRLRFVLVGKMELVDGEVLLQPTERNPLLEAIKRIDAGHGRFAPKGGHVAEVISVDFRRRLQAVG